MDFVKKYISDQKKWIICALFIFCITLSPHVVTILTGSFFSRFSQVGSMNGKFVFDFFKHMFNNFSPKYLFSDAGSDLARIAPNLGMFYSLFLIPFFVGLYYLGNIVVNKYLKFLCYLTIIFLVPVSLTGDVFYPLRILEFLWIVAVVVSIGIFKIGMFIKNSYYRYLVLLVSTVYVLSNFYISYFVLYQHETTEPVGAMYLKLSNILSKYNDYKFVIDSPRDPAIGLRIAYFRYYDPIKLQKVLIPQISNNYYKIEPDSREDYIIDNIETRSVSWGKDRCSEKTILIGDLLSFSGPQIIDHNLTKEFEIMGLNNKVSFFGYKTNPDKGCLNLLKNK